MVQMFSFWTVQEISRSEARSSHRCKAELPRGLGGPGTAAWWPLEQLPRPPAALADGWGIRELLKETFKIIGKVEKKSPFLSQRKTNAGFSPHSMRLVGLNVLTHTSLSTRWARICDISLNAIVIWLHFAPSHMKELPWAHPPLLPLWWCLGFQKNWANSNLGQSEKKGKMHENALIILISPSLSLALGYRWSTDGCTRTKQRVQCCAIASIEASVRAQHHVKLNVCKTPSKFAAPSCRILLACAKTEQIKPTNQHHPVGLRLSTTLKSILESSNDIEHLLSWHEPRKQQCSHLHSGSHKDPALWARAAWLLTATNIY